MDTDSTTAPVDRSKNETLCEICQSNASRYKCPRCSIRTCSVGCVKRHKAEQQCSGERSKTHFVPRDQYNYSTMMSDYVYLEDVARKSDILTRERLRAPQYKNLGPREKTLLGMARRYGIRYEMLPAGMSRHKMNNTNYNESLKQVFWTIECNFCKPDHTQKFIQHSVPMLKTLRAIFENMLLAEEPQGKGEFAVIRYQAREFIEKGIDKLAFGLKKEGGRAKTFVNLKPHMDRRLKDILRGERIIEFPIIHVWMEDTMDPDIVLEEKIMTFNKQYNRPRNTETGGEKQNDAETVGDKQNDTETEGEKQSEPDTLPPVADSEVPDDIEGVNETVSHDKPGS